MKAIVTLNSATNSKVIVAILLQQILTIPKSPICIINLLLLYICLYSNAFVPKIKLVDLDTEKTQSNIWVYWDLFTLPRFLGSIVCMDLIRFCLGSPK